MKTTLQLFLISGALALLDASHLEGATNVAVSAIPPITTVGTNDLLLLDSYNSPGSYTTHTITWSSRGWKRAFIAATMRGGRSSCWAP